MYHGVIVSVNIICKIHVIIKYGLNFFSYKREERKFSANLKASISEIKTVKFTPRTTKTTRSTGSKARQTSRRIPESVARNRDRNVSSMIKQSSV